jgi:hypothetical protein
VGLIGVWRGGVSLIGVAFVGVGFIGGRGLAMVEWNVMVVQRTDGMFPQRFSAMNTDCAGVHAR